MAFLEKSSFAIRLVLIVVAVLVLVVLISQYQKKKTSVVAEEQPFISRYENFEAAAPSMPISQQLPEAAPATAAASAPAAQQNSVRPNEALENEDYKAVDFSVEQKATGDCFPRDKSLTASDLLPKDAANSTWAQVVPASQGDVDNQNYLSAGFHVGINTISSSRKNASHDLRSSPPNPKLAVSPWMNSTVEPDQSRRYFEIGEC